MIKIFIIILLLLIIFYGILKSNIPKEKFIDRCFNDIDEKIYVKDEREFEVPDGNSNTEQTIGMTRKIMETLSQSHADAEYDYQVGSIDSVNPPPGTKR